MPAAARQIAEYNKLGVRVRYLFYPRTGPDTEAWAKAETVWCSADRKAFTAPSRAKDLKKAAPRHPWRVNTSWAGHRDQGTPGVVLETGN